MPFLLFLSHVDVVLPPKPRSSKFLFPPGRVQTRKGEENLQSINVKSSSPMTNSHLPSSKSAHGTPDAKSKIKHRKHDDTHNWLTESGIDQVLTGICLDKYLTSSREYIMSSFISIC